VDNEIKSNDMNGREKQFLQKLHELEELARTQGGMVTREQADEAVAGLGLDDEQKKLTDEYLRSHNVGIDAAASPEDYLDKEELDYFREYQEEIKALPEYTEGEKEAYTISAMAGDKGAQRALAEIFLPQVLDIAKLYAGQGAMLEDLVGEGNAALAAGVSMLAAMENAAEAQGMLTKMIMDAMEELVKEEYDSARVDDKLVKKLNKVADSANELARELERKVTVEELMQETGMSRQYILDAMRLSGNRIETIVKPDDAGF
jgi:RNA polymerase primary sigma factor